MTGPSPFRLRPIAAADLDAVQALVAQAAWPHRREDTRFALGLGRGTVAVREDGGVVGNALWWPNGAAVATVGYVVVSSDCRGAGIGRRLMDEVLAAAGERRLELTATPAGFPLYERLGFAVTGRMHQRQGIASPVGELVPSAGRIRALVEDDMPALRSLDARTTGRDRSRLLDALAAVAVARVHEVEGRLAGFAFERAFGRGRAVGPLVAEDDAAAVALFAPSAAACAGGFLRADTPMGEGAFPAVLDRAGLACVDVARTMARGAAGEPRGPARPYCVASQALG